MTTQIDLRHSDLGGLSQDVTPYLKIKSIESKMITIKICKVKLINHWFLTLLITYLF